MADIEGLFSRRKVLKGVGGAAVAGLGATYATGVFAASGGALATAEYAEWAAKVGTNFTAHTGQVLKLVEVARLPSSGARPEPLRDNAFVARFDITRGTAMSEAVYSVSYPKGTAFNIFLSKGGPDKPARMLAVFN